MIRLENLKHNKIVLPPILLLRILSFLIIIPLIASETDAERKLPFVPGEKMVFQVRWAFITAGEASLELLPMETIDGDKAFHIVFKAKTNEYIDVFYKVRDVVESFVDIDMTHSLLYKKQHKGKSLKEVIVKFDWEAGEATYSNFGQAIDPVEIMPGTFDPLSVFFAFRLFDLDNVREIVVPVTDGKKCIKGIARVIRREEINVSGTDYDAYLVEPDLEHIGGVFKKKKNAKLQIWVTADEKCVPIRIKSKVIVGSFIADLVSYKD